MENFLAELQQSLLAISGYVVIILALLGLLAFIVLRVVRWVLELFLGKEAAGIVLASWLFRGRRSS